MKENGGAGAPHAADTAGLQSTVHAAALWSAAAGAAALVHPPAAAWPAPGRADPDTAALIIHTILTAAPIGAATAAASFAAGHACAQDPEFRSKLLRVVLPAGLLLGAAGGGTPLLAAGCAIALLGGTMRGEGAAARTTAGWAAAMAAAAPAGALALHAAGLWSASGAYGVPAGELMGWSSVHWNRDPSWAAAAQAAYTQDWNAWADGRRLTGIAASARNLVLGTDSGLAAAAAAAAGAAAAKGRGFALPRAVGKLTGAFTAAAAARTLAAAGSGWGGLGAALSRAAAPTTGIGAAIWAAAVFRRLGEKRGGNRRRGTGEKTRRGDERGRRNAERPELKPKELALAWAGAYAAGTAAVLAIPWTSPTPINTGLYGQLTGLETLWAMAAAALAAEAIWTLIEERFRSAGKSKEN